MSDSTPSMSGGINSFTDLLAIAFISLKLTGYIDWSWFWVLAPLWIPLVLGLLLGSILIGYDIVKD